MQREFHSKGILWLSSSEFSVNGTTLTSNKDAIPRQPLKFKEASQVITSQRTESLAQSSVHEKADKICDNCNTVTSHKVVKKQVRSYDEGKSIFYTCTVCSHESRHM